jgi:RNA polymerase sigma-70 factor (ECF subfamily)
VAAAPDDDLLEAARRGDADALTALIERYQPRIYGFGMKMCRNPEDAQDIVQDTLLAAARSVRNFRGAASVSTWLYTIARSFCIKKRRKSKFAPEHMVSLESESARGAFELPDLGRAPDQALHDHQVRQALERAVAALEPAYREVLVLRDMEGLPAAEVAEVMDLSVEAVKSRLHRARASVRRALVPLLDPAAASAAAPGCPDIVKLFSRHLEGEINPDTCTEMERHLARCERCQAACDSLKDTLRLCRSGPAPQVPPAIQASIKAGIRDLVAGKA